MMDTFSLIFLLALGFVIIFAPNLLPLFNTNINFEELYEIIPHYCFVLIGILVVVTTASLISFKIWKLFRKTVAIRQVSENVIGAGHKMDFPLLAKIDIAITEDMGSTVKRKKHSEENKDIFQKNVEMRFAINNIERIKKIKYLGADYIPYIVQLGVILNQCNKLIYYHNFIKGNNSKVKKLHFSLFHKFSHFEVVKNKIKSEKSESNEIVICVESSASFNYDSMPENLRTMDCIRISTSCLDRSSINTLNKLNQLTSVVVETLKECSAEYSKIHLMICGSSSLCLSIGRSIRINEMKPILVYDFDNTNAKKPRPWHITLDN